MRTLRLSGPIFVGVTLTLLAACATPPGPDQHQLGEEQTRELAELGSRNFGIQWEGKVMGAQERGVRAVTDGVTTLTTRAGRRVFILHNRKAFPPTEENDFKGSDEELKSIGRKLLATTGVKDAEIADIQVLRQFIQVGERIEGGKDIRLQPARPSHRTLLVSRRIEGIDVVSSRLLLNVGAGGQLTFMELSWPDFPREVMERAVGLRRAADARFLPPPLDGAEVEAVQPVLLHSPAVGFYNDTAAALRVIYRPTSKQVGQKAVHYLDERGAEVALPRDVERPHEEPVRRVAKSQ